MNLIIGYFKRNSLKLLIVFVLLIGEAISCIVSPILLGKMIGTGIQCMGFDDQFPVVMNYSTLKIINNVLPESEFNILKSNYENSFVLPEYIDNKYYSESKKYYLKNNADTDKVKEIYQNGVISAIIIFKDYLNVENIDYNSLSGNISIPRISMVLEKLSLSEDEKSYYYSNAVNIPYSLKEQASQMILSDLYEFSNIDCETACKEYIGSTSIILIIIVVVQFLIASMSSYLISSVSSDTEYNIKRDLLKNISSFSQDDFSNLSPQYVYECFSNRTRQLGMALNFSIRNILYSLFIVIAGCIYTFTNSLWFGFLNIIIFIFIFIVIAILYKLCKPKYYRMQSLYGKFSSKVKTNIRNILFIRNSGAQSLEYSQSAELSENIMKDESFIMKSVLFALSMMGLFINALTTLIIFIGGNDMLNSGVSLAEIISDLQISLLEVSSLLNLSIMVVFSPSIVNSVKDISSVLHYTPHVNMNTINEPVDKIESVYFMDYKSSEVSKVQNFRLEKGKITVFTGSTGSGKTMLIKSLLCEAKHKSGKIFINDKDIESLSYKSFIEKICYVPSTPVIFTDSIRNNMRIFGSDKSETDMLNALKFAECDFFRTDKNILDIKLNNNADLFSGGQRSRLTLAFAVSKKSDIYIFDDCLSSLDYDTKNRVLKNIENLKKDSIVVLISQDKNDLNFADKIVDFD